MLMAIYAVTWLFSSYLTMSLCDCARHTQLWDGFLCMRAYGSMGGRLNGGTLGFTGLGFIGI